MRKLARVLSAILVITMMFSLVAFADETATTTSTVTLSDIDPDTVTGKAVAQLVKLGIINGYEDGTYRPDETISRAEMAKVITCFLNIDHLASDAMVSGFPDVDDAGHWGKKFVKLAVDKKIVVGFEDGTFKPDADVTYVQAVKMIVCALNYGTIAETKQQPGAAWYQGYMTVAAEQGILNSASVNNQEAAASRGTVAVLIYNALSVDVPEISTSGEITIKPGSSALETILNKEEITGVVTGVYQTGLTDGSTGLSKRNIIVETKKGEREFQVGKDVDTYALLGRQIEGYAEDADFEDIDVLTDITKTKKNSVTVVTPDMIDEVKSSSLSYYPEDEDKETIAFASDMAVIYNGKALSDYDSDIFENIKSGKIEFLCNNNDGEAEVAFITSYKLYVVSSYDKNDDKVKVYSMYNGGTLEIPEEDNSKMLFSLTKDGADFEASSITKWDVISVMESDPSSTGKPVWEGIVTRKKVSGQKIKVVSDDETVELGGKSYKFSYIFEEYTGAKPTFELNTSPTVYLDHEGKIAAANASTTSSSAATYVAYLINAEEGKGFDETGVIQVFGLTGKTNERLFNLAKKVTVDGKLYSSTSEVLEALIESSEIANETKIDNEEFDAEIELTQYAQLIRYTTNKDNEVDTIDTVVPNVETSTDELTLSVPFPNNANVKDEKTMYYPVSGQFEYTENVEGGGTKTKQLLVNAQTTILLISGGSVEEVDDMNVKSFSSAFSTSSSYRVEAYNVSSVDVAKYVIVYGNAGANGYNDKTPFVLTKSIVTKMGENGKQDSFNGWTLKGVDVEDLRTVSEGMLADYEVGEIFTYLTNADDEIRDVKDVLHIEDGVPVLCYDRVEGDENYDRLRPLESPADAKSERIFMVDDSTRSATSSHNRFYFGTIIGRDGNVIKVNNTLSTDVYGIDVDASSENFTLNINESDPESSTTKIYVYDSSESKEENRLIANASVDNLRSVDELEEAGADINDASKVLIYMTQNKNVRTVIIFK